MGGGEELADIVDRVKAITGRIDLVHANNSRDAFDSGRRPARQLRLRDVRLRADRAVCRDAGSDVIVETPMDGIAADVALLKAALR